MRSSLSGKEALLHVMQTFLRKFSVQLNNSTQALETPISSGGMTEWWALLDPQDSENLQEHFQDTQKGKYSILPHLQCLFYFILESW